MSKPKNKTDNRQITIIIGSLLILLSVLLLISFSSYLFNWEVDQSNIKSFNDRSIQTENILSKTGALVGHFFIYKLFGVASYIFVYLIFVSGSVLFFNTKTNLLSKWLWGLLYMIFICLNLSFFYDYSPILAGVVGFEISNFIIDYIGQIGFISFLIFFFLCLIVLKWNFRPEIFLAQINKLIQKKEINDIITNENKSSDSLVFNDKTEANKDLNEYKKEQIESENEEHDDVKNSFIDKNKIITNKPKVSEDLKIQIETFNEEVDKDISKDLVSEYGPVDPTLELSKFKMPPIDLLEDYPNPGITINEEELEDNKRKIVDTLLNYKIGIAQIKATIGPTVTLYEIVPDAGIKISKIKNLEDDIALSLSALGIRIIAPIPGKGTIGIEVPNQNPSIVSMRSVISSTNFQKAEMELPIAIGKTISNETFVVDLTKMPHLLMAGATGQGKSVGLNAVISSFLYKKHPAEVKFVLVDPKKIELTLYNKIERHYLAKLPDSSDSIITDNTKVIKTLNSLCIEMDNRYELLKNAMCRNLIEYNKKFINRKLNPNDGHKFLPYIVLIIDEFADLIMTAGKEVETPIARLAQLARAIGIHLIIATQRPSVNVITGLIKANFPARIAFRVTSKIDSRTILDTGGADQLIGRGDMLYTQGNELSRIQCAFIDTPEVDQIADYIGSQTGYGDAYILPEYISDDNKIIDIDASERDSLFREAAEVIVIAQQGSASLLQRKLKLGYNRAGRIIDQMEAAGIVGPFEGSKARQVLILDLNHLNNHLSNEDL